MDKIHKYGMALLLLFLCLPVDALAQSSGVINSNAVAIRSEPNAKSEILLEAEKETELKVLEQRGDWLKVRVVLDKSFSFDGWVSRQFVDLKSTPHNPKTTRKPSPIPTSIPQSPPSPNPTASPSDLDRFFEPAKPE